MAKIVVVGLGYVGLSNAVLLATDYNNEVIGIDINQEKIAVLNQKISPLVDKELQEWLQTTEINFSTIADYSTADYIIIAAPTNFVDEINSFDMSILDSIINDIQKQTNTAIIVIKSTVPIGYTESVRKKFNYEHIVFMPEFLREGKAFLDCMYPSRIVVGGDSNDCSAVLKLYNNICRGTYNCYSMSRDEAEAVKLFANTYLAMRVAYFNELDNFAIKNNLNAVNIINGICSDNRIGDYYNNPSFGYGGYCLPKDTKQLLTNYINSNVPNELISAVINSNSIRKNFIADQILNMNISTVGIYKLAMKSNSDNYRQSAIIDIITLLQNKDINCIIYDDTITTDEFMGCKVEHDFTVFSNECEIILANRLESKLMPILNKVFSCDRVGGN